MSSSAVTAPPTVVRRRRVNPLILVGGAFLLLALTSLVTGVHNVNSSGTLRAAVLSAVPIAMAGLAGIWSERAGVVNIGLEGMMLLGCLGAGYFTYWYDPWTGVLGGIAFGAVGGALHALACVVFGVDHIVSGVAVNILALGVTGFLSDAFFSGTEGGGPTQSPSLADPPTLTIGPIAELARDLEQRHWFLVSDLASLVGAVSRQLSLLLVVAVILVLVSSYVLWRTSFGLRLRSCGENPVAAESLGVNVYRYKILAVLVSGGIAGFGGAFLVLVTSGLYQNGMTAGRGYIGLAAMIFGNWRPSGMLLGAGLFGYTDALQLRAGGEAVHALLIVLAVVLLGVAIMRFRAGRRVPAVVSLVGAALFAAWFFTTDSVPADFTRMTPYVTTLLVLALASQKLRMPAADGQIYRRGSAG